jgi:uncharacterized membrane protein
MIKVMKLISKKEFLLTLSLLVLVFALYNPFGTFMPSVLDMVILALLVVVIGLFAGFVVNEKVTDEREIGHRAMAGRSGFTAGLLVVLLGIVFQGLQHKPIDGWLLVALVAMVLVKIFSRIYSRNYR